MGMGTSDSPTEEVCGSALSLVLVSVTLSGPVSGFPASAGGDFLQDETDTASSNNTADQIFIGDLVMFFDIELYVLCLTINCVFRAKINVTILLYRCRIVKLAKVM
jgi:hypothetical protein